MNPDRELLRKVLLMDLAEFVRRAIADMPGIDLTWTWHLSLLCSRLEDLAAGRFRRLLVCVPPRSLKSLICSVIYPAWLLARNEAEAILCISYAQSLAEDFSRQCRRLMESEFYLSTFSTRLSPDRRAAEQFETTKGGYRIASSVGGTITGRGGSFIIVDDAMKPDDARSDALRNSSLEWVKGTLASRANNKLTDRQLTIMQRVHEDDVAGHFLSTGDWEALILAAIATEDEEHHFTVAGVPVIHIRKAGEPLQPEREPLHVLETLKNTMGTFNFQAQYQQNPVPSEGNMVRRSWFKTYDAADLIGIERVIMSLDVGSKTGDSNDYSACTTFGLKAGNIFILDQWRGKLEMPELCRKVIELSDQFRPERVLIEDKNNGTALLQALRAQYFHKGIGVGASISKEARLASASPTIEAGHVYLPRSADWLDDFLHELCAFPRGKNDDQVDSFSQGIRWINDQGNPGGIFDFYRQQHEVRIAAAEHRTVRLRAPAQVNQCTLRDGTCLAVGADGTIWVAANDVAPLRLAGFTQLE